MKSLTEKVCNTCKETKPASEFYLRTKNGMQFLQGPCVTCKKAYTQERRDAGIITTDSRYNRIWKLSRKYGLTYNQYLDMLDKQDWCCPICCTELEHESPHVDHDHSTGKVRGILCGNCNKGLGMFKDDINRLREAVKYLESKVWNA